MPEGYPNAHEDKPEDRREQFSDEQAPGAPETQLLSPEDRVEELLENSAMLFASVQGLWQSVSNLYETIPKDNKTVVRPHLQDNPETGKAQPVKIITSPQTRKQERETKNLPPHKVLAHIKHYTYGIAEDFEGLGWDLYDTTPLDELAETVCATIIPKVRQEWGEGVREPLSIQGVEFKTNTQQLIEQCIGAFATQAVAIRCLGDMLSDDELAPVLIDRIQELAAEAQAAPTEYPGLLETIAVHLAIAQSKNEKNVIEQALEWLAEQKYTDIDFAQDILTDGPNDRETRTLRSFVSQLAAAQMIIAAIGLDFSDKEIATRIAAYFNSDASFADPDFVRQWKNAYKVRVAQATTQKADDFAHALKPYERGGRRKTRLPSLRPQYDEQQNTKKRRHQKDKSTDNQRSPDAQIVEDLVEKKRYKPAVFNTMVQTGTTQYELREIGDIDALMEQPVVTDFLKQHPGENFDNDLRKYLQDIAQNPKMHPKVKGNPISLSLQQSRANRIRRYSPMEQIASTPLESLSVPSAEVISNTGGELSRRIRILYVATEKGNKSHVGILQISLKDTQTYS